jgi:hypothetical protein
MHTDITVPKAIEQELIKAKEQAEESDQLNEAFSKYESRDSEQ